MRNFRSVLNSNRPEVHFSLRSVPLREGEMKLRSARVHFGCSGQSESSGQLKICMCAEKIFKSGPNETCGEK